MCNGDIQVATQDDLPFLLEMLYLAICWNPEEHFPPKEELLARPELEKLLQGWGRTGDYALIALSKDGERVGAAWFRFWNQTDQSYGFVNEATPELGLAVIRGRRRCGIGNRLLCELLHEAEKSGIVHVSLSVDPMNGARMLYERMGFKKVGESGTSWTMAVKVEDAVLHCGNEGV